LAQTNGMIYNIMRKVNVNRLYCPGCGFYDYNWDGEPFHNLWVDTTYNGLEIDAPVEIDADVWGIEAGSDIQRDLHNKLGIFVSYRRGNYEMNGKGEDYFSPLSSELDINSYLGGLYYRYDNNNWYAFATLYGGMQEAEIETKDGVSSDTDGIEFGGSAELGYSYALNKTLYLTPSLGVFYTQVNYDDTTDSAGKTVEYNDLKQVELEAGLKLSKAVYTDDGSASVYVKPSVVQTLIDGDEINVSGLGKIDTIEDETLGRIELGGSYGFNEQWSAYGWANYTFGSDYEATSLGLGVNYSW
ncbi:MAG: autotransporter outer membrane beta-barrel domain-containing protein, partial [Alphaproteobacteria bacterium]|nr:autotransporter outer membrane beta-barrel domain-containing protein [Alphaproteobacteria bacterium]